MKKIFFTILLVAFKLLSFGQKYAPVDEGSNVRFVIKNFGINTGGTFEGLSGTIIFDPTNLQTAKFDVSVKANTVDTDIEARDRDLRKSGYLHVEKYPTINFTSTRISKTNSSGFLYMFGTITIKGVSKEIKFPFKASPKNEGCLFEGNFKLNRRDFNVGGSSLSLADELNVTLSVFAKKS